MEHEQATAGLNPQDEQRARSMADEGGAAGAVVEAEVPDPPARRRRTGRLLAMGAAACSGIAAFWLCRRFRT
jgi:hypothetical protein